MVFPEDQLTILAYNRVVKDLNGVAEKAFEERREVFLRDFDTSVSEDMDPQ